MAWKASSTRLFAVGAPQQHGNLTGPAQHAKFLLLTASTFHQFHKEKLQKFVLTGTCGTTTCPPSVAQDNPPGTFQYDVLWCCEIPSLMWMALKKWPNKAEGWNLYLWEKYLCILHLRSSYLRSPKKGFKQEQGKDFFPSEKLLPKIWWQTVQTGTTVFKTPEKQVSSNTGIRHHSWDHNSWAAKTTFPLG